MYKHNIHDPNHFLCKCNNVLDAIIVNTKMQRFQHKNHQACSDRQLIVQSFSTFCELTTQRQTSLVLTWIFHTIVLLHWLGGENMSRVVRICPSFSILSMLVHNSTVSPFVLYSLSEGGGEENPIITNRMLLVNPHQANTNCNMHAKICRQAVIVNLRQDNTGKAIVFSWHWSILRYWSILLL